MSTPDLPKVHELAQHLGPEIAENTNALWQIYGPPTAGKTALLATLSDALESHGLRAITASPPTHALDAGPSAVIEVAGGLRTQGAINGELESLTDPARKWTDKLEDLRSWINRPEVCDNIVLLLDEPETWPARASDDLHFAAQAQDVTNILMSGVSCRRVVTGRISGSLKPQALHRLPPTSRPADWLQNPSAWGALADAAARLWIHHGEQLSAFSPLQIRLLVALASIEDDGALTRLVAKNSSRREISRRLASAISANRDLKELTRTWATLALVRRPFSAAVVSLAGGDRLRQPARDILLYCLLYRHKDAYVLHDTLKLDAANQGWLTREKAAHIHRNLADFYSRAFQQTSATPADFSDSLIYELEAFHHAASSADPYCLDKHRPFFVSQLDALGRYLSRDARKYRDAAIVFDRAINWDDEDDYAHHYLAFNLDVIAEEAKRVDHHFGRAVALNPTSVWWHSRYICFLVARGRSRAAQNAWDAALDALGLPDTQADPYVYENLHLWVARLLLHRGQLTFARQVLDGIPSVTRDRHPGLGALYRRLRALEQARQTGAVFPLTVSPDRWWKGPHLCPLRLDNGHELVRWLAGRVDGIEDGYLELFVAKPPEDSEGEPSYGHLRISFAEFDGWTRDQRARELAAGRFLELGFYGRETDQRVVVRVHREGPWQDPDLPPLFPDPSRYLRKMANGN